MLKKSASSVLASLSGTVKRETRVSLGAAALPGTRRVSARQGWVGEKSGLFEHPARVSSSYASLHAIETLLRYFLKFPP